MRLFAAIRADLADLNRRVNPWGLIREAQSDIKTLKAQVAAEEAISAQHAAEIEFLRARLAWYQQLETRADHIEEQFRILYEIERGLEEKQLANAGQMIEFGNDLEKLRLRLSGPATDPKDQNQRPKPWPERRRELEREYATKSAVSEEKPDAGKSNAS
jgi:hypothetical protein